MENPLQVTSFAPRIWAKQNIEYDPEKSSGRRFLIISYPCLGGLALPRQHICLKCFQPACTVLRGATNRLQGS